MSISGITSKSIEKNGIKDAFLVSAQATADKLILLFEVQSSRDNNKHVNIYGQVQSFLKHGYSVTIAFYQISRFVPKTWLQEGAQKAKQYIATIVKNCDVKVSCDCPAFYWQGMWEGDDKKKTDYLDFAGTHGKGVWNAKHAQSGGKIGQQMCKHIYAAANSVFRQIDNIVAKLGIEDDSSLVEQFIQYING